MEGLELTRAFPAVNASRVSIFSARSPLSSLSFTTPRFSVFTVERPFLQLRHRIAPRKR
jgi:hypothetical protein